MRNIKISTTVDIELPDHEVEVEIDSEEVLDEVGLDECLEHFDNPTEVMDWLESNHDASSIAEWVVGDESLKTATLQEIALDDDGRAAAIQYLGGASGQPKLTDGDFALIATALGAIAAECEHIAACAVEGTVREAFQQSAAAYRALREKVGS